MPLARFTSMGFMDAAKQVCLAASVTPIAVKGENRAHAYPPGRDNVVMVVCEQGLYYAVLYINYIPGFAM